MSNHPFDLLMELKTNQIQLDCAALHLARDVFPTMNIRHYLGLLDSMARHVAALRPGLAANLRYEAMRTVLADYHGLIGDHELYYHPDGSYLNRVLDRGRGVPISLSIVWIEVARRLKWPVAGVALPGHFIIRFDDAERFILVDPFHGGRTLSLDDCNALVVGAFNGKVPFGTGQLRPVTTRRILLRLLTNLRNVYLAENDLDRVGTVVRRMAALEPGNGRHIQDLAAICCRRGDVRGAAAHLELYLRRLPDAHDTVLVRSTLKQLHAALLALN